MHRIKSIGFTASFGGVDSRSFSGNQQFLILSIFVGGHSIEAVGSWFPLRKSGHACEDLGFNAGFDETLDEKLFFIKRQKRFKDTFPFRFCWWSIVEDELCQVKFVDRYRFSEKNIYIKISDAFSCIFSIATGQFQTSLNWSCLFNWQKTPHQ